MIAPVNDPGSHTFVAETLERRRGFQRAHFVVLPGAHILDLAGPLQIIATLAELGLAQVSAACVGPIPEIETFQGNTLSRIGPLPQELDGADVVFAIGSKLDRALMRSAPWQQTVEWLRRVVAPTVPRVRVCGVCTGTFLLGQAGLLDERQCTTHFRSLQELQTLCSSARVVGNRLVVHDRGVWTSAGVSSGSDLALHLIVSAFGESTALQVAQENVVPFRRFGRDPELRALLRYRGHGNRTVHKMQDLIAETLAEKTTLNALCAQLGVSTRHMARVFSSEVGITLKQYQAELRIEYARELLAHPGVTVAHVARRCGFASVQGFRAQWDRHEMVSPTQLRKAEGPPLR